jgi:hypothetical protein
MQYPIEPVVLFHKIDFTIAEIVYLSLLDKIRKDVEEIEKPPYEIMHSTFTQNEIKQIVNCCPHEKAGMFYKI